MSIERSEPEREFFSNGAALYLDVEDAVEEFRRQVREMCERAVESRLREIRQACQMDWTLSALKDYRYAYPEGRHVGKQLAVKGLGTLYFCLEVYREAGHVVYGALVYLYRPNGDIAKSLWDRVTDTPSAEGYREGNNLCFERRIPSDRVTDFEEYLREAAEAFISFMSLSGGLKKYL